jgi:hypothetical protein
MDGPDGPFACVEATERTPTEAAAADYWRELEGTDRHEPMGAIWLRETDQVRYFGDTPQHGKRVRVGTRARGSSGGS